VVEESGSETATRRIQNEIPPTSTCYRKLKSIGGRGGTPDDKKDSWKQIYNSLAKIKRKRKKEPKERIRRGKAPIFLHPMYLYQGCSNAYVITSLCIISDLHLIFSHVQPSIYYMCCHLQY